MNPFLNIARMLPMAILLAFAMVTQTIAMSLHGAGHGAVSQFLVTICADGELKMIALDENGDPAKSRHEEPHCPFCILGEAFGSPLQYAAYTQARHANDVSFSANTHSSKVDQQKPDSLHCLDPPSVWSENT